MAKLPLIHFGDQVFLSEGGIEFGAVVALAPNGRAAITVFVENSGEFEVELDAVKSVHDGKVLLVRDRLEPEMRGAITRAHHREDPAC